LLDDLCSISSATWPMADSERLFCSLLFLLRTVAGCRRWFYRDIGLGGFANRRFALLALVLLASLLLVLCRRAWLEGCEVRRRVAIEVCHHDDWPIFARSRAAAVDGRTGDERSSTAARSPALSSIGTKLTPSSISF
jgi:hypothetical protein